MPSPPMECSGFLNLNKPAGLTSHDCVARVRRALSTRKVGHGGTLDPAATGVLPIGVGRATRYLSFLGGEKRYQATFRLGQVSATDDAEGELLRQDPCPELGESEVRAALRAFEGDIWQVPPIYSAIKRGGQKLYELARNGIQAEDLQLEPRLVRIQSIQVLAWRSLGSYPEIDLEIACGSGTYIRAIARDLGQKLGCGGLMSQLVRLASGPFALETSIDLEALKTLPDPSSALLPVETAFATLPLCELSLAEGIRWCQGQQIAVDLPDAALLRVRSNHFLGLGQIQSGCLRALRVLPNGSEL